jgi:hypothetical protein
MAGQTATITVTATDPSDGTSTSQSFTVAVGSYAGPSNPAINFRPFANPVSVSAAGTSQTNITLAGQSGFPTTTTPGTLSYALVSQPGHGTISNFNATTGTLTYTPSPGFQGTDTFQYQVTATEPGATPVTTQSSPGTVTVAVTPPLVTVSGARVETNRRHQVIEVLITFSGPVNAAGADNTATYRLATPGKHGSFTAKNAKTIKLKSATYDGTNDTVTLVPRKPFALRKPVQVLVYGQPPSGLQDSSGRLIDGGENGKSGSNAVVILTRAGASIDALTAQSSIQQSNWAANKVDVLVAQSERDGLSNHPSKKQHLE